MTTPSTPHPRVQFLIDMFAQWLRHRRELSEIRQMDREDFERIAVDLQISPGDLDELVRHGAHAADELPDMLKALGIDEAALSRSEPLVLAHGACLRHVQGQAALPSRSRRGHGRRTLRRLLPQCADDRPPRRKCRQARLIRRLIELERSPGWSCIEQ